LVYMVLNVGYFQKERKLKLALQLIYSYKSYLCKMGTKDKLLQRFRSKPKDFTFDELKRLLKRFGYQEQQGSGSRVIFVNENLTHKIKLHKPHPENIVKRYQLDLIEQELEKNQLL
jgi:predicted RNA binding protein YcfA (HicA-like mRNA interferase family)